MRGSAFGRADLSTVVKSAIYNFYSDLVMFVRTLFGILHGRNMCSSFVGLRQKGRMPRIETTPDIATAVPSTTGMLAKARQPWRPECLLPCENHWVCPLDTASSNRSRGDVISEAGCKAPCAFRFRAAKRLTAGIGVRPLLPRPEASHERWPRPGVEVPCLARPGRTPHRSAVPVQRAGPADLRPVPAPASRTAQAACRRPGLRLPVL